MSDASRPWHDAQHPAVDAQRPWIEAAPASTEDQWASLAIDNGRLLTEARMKLADAETQRTQQASRYAELLDQTDTIRQELVRVMHDRDAHAAKAAAAEQSYSNALRKMWNPADRRKRALRWVVALRRELRFRTWEADGWRIKAAGTAKQLAAATARSRAAREECERLEAYANRVEREHVRAAAERNELRAAILAWGSDPAHVLFELHHETDFALWGRANRLRAAAAEED